MSTSTKRNRKYRYRVQCEECSNQFDSGYKDLHFRKVDDGKVLNCKLVVKNSQRTLVGFIKRLPDTALCKPVAGPETNISTSEDICIEELL